MSRVAKTIAVAAVLTVASFSYADQIQSVMYMGQVSFDSDLNPSQNIILPGFDNMGGTLTLLNVIVEVFHSGSVHPRGDNDDPTRGAPFTFLQMRARSQRMYNATGPGVNVSDGNLIVSPFFVTGADDGDGGNNNVFDDTGPDGHDFGSLAYGPLSSGTTNPALALYDGVANVNFTVTPTLMADTLQFDPATPGAWQLEVEDPVLTVKVAVTYEYKPEPTTMSLLGLGGLALLRRRRR
ncbi:MAG: PEP-CTERM sorting domain-containing protein [Phycisphaerae bacterium]|nr:PEP-CTERM sorting domain-containing protein [Phycisphaerae bacterium]